MTTRGGEPHPPWYKDAVIYELHVQAFNDGNARRDGRLSGVDRAPGLSAGPRRDLPLAPAVLSLSAARTTATTSPTTPASTPTTGARSDFQDFLDEAHRRGLRVITELVLNHTSDQHPWFQQCAPCSVRQRRAWTTTSGATPTSGTREPASSSVTLSRPTGAGTPSAGAYYWHRF